MSYINASIVAFEIDILYFNLLSLQSRWSYYFQYSAIINKPAVNIFVCQHFPLFILGENPKCRTILYQNISIVKDLAIYSYVDF